MMHAVKAERLTRQAFRPFGDVIEIPSQEDEAVGQIRSTGSLTSTGLPQGQEPAPQPVNHGTALKFADISAMSNAYESTGRTARATLSLFVCAPGQIRERFNVSKLTGRHLILRVLERHPYTTQTFIPMGLGYTDTSTSFLVVVAPTITLQDNSGAPDLLRVRAFFAHGRQAITYGIGVWHAPMVVIGLDAIHCTVVQHVNGIHQDDCQEVDLDNDLLILINDLPRGVKSSL